MGRQRQIETEWRRERVGECEKGEWKKQRDRERAHLNAMTN